MKKYLIAITIMVLHQFSLAQNSAKQNAAQTTFGRYGSDCSSGRGACSFMVFKNESGIVTQKTSKKTSENTISLQISRNVLTKEEEIKIAGKPFSELSPAEPLFFVQQDDLGLNSETVLNLNIDPKYTKIASGNYPMTITKDRVEIVFTLK